MLAIKTQTPFYSGSLYSPLWSKIDRFLPMLLTILVIGTPLICFAEIEATPAPATTPTVIAETTPRSETPTIALEIHEDIAQVTPEQTEPEVASALNIGLTRGLTGRLAFSIEVDGQWRVMVLDLDARKVRRLIDGPGSNGYPSWSPDGKQVAFVSDRDGNREIYTADWMGGNQKRLTKSNGAADSPAWSPDGTKILYVVNAKHGTAKDINSEDDSNIFEIELATGKVTQLTNFKGRNTVPHWGPNPNIITYSTNRFWPGWDVCNWDIKKRDETCILNGARSYCRAAWSPDGQRIAYSESSLDPRQIDISVLNVKTRSRDTMTSIKGKEYDAVFAPNGMTIAFTADEDNSGLFNLFAVGQDKKTTNLLRSPYSIRYPNWTGIKTIDLESQRILEQEALAAASTPVPPTPLSESPPPTEEQLLGSLKKE